MTVKIFGYEVNLLNVAKVAALVASVFSLNNMQEKQIDQYVRLNHIQWIEKRKRDSEIEQLIEDKVSEIK